MGRMLIGVVCMSALAIAGCKDPNYRGRHHHKNPEPRPVVVHQPANGGHPGSVKPPAPPPKTTPPPPATPKPPQATPKPPVVPPPPHRK